MDEADRLTVTMRVGEQVYANTILVAPLMPTRESERRALDEMLWHLEREGIAYSEADRRTVKMRWHLADGSSIESGRRQWLRG